MRRNIFTVTILLLSYCNMYSQISTDEEPISFRANIPALRDDKNTLKALPLLDMKKIEQEDKEDEANGIPPRFGYRHEVNYNLENSGEWIELSNGDRITLEYYVPNNVQEVGVRRHPRETVQKQIEIQRKRENRI